MTISPNEQLNQILESERPLLVTGGPGSGKTTSAILKATKELQALDEFQKALFLSFSNSATNQVKQKAIEHLQRSELKDLTIQTYHSFCFSLLKSFGGLIGLYAPVKIFPPEEEKTIHEKFGFTNEAESMKYLFEQAQKESRVSFSLFSKLAVRVLQNRQVLEIVHLKYPFIFIDEFQDTDEDEWELIQLLGANSTLICLADPLQRIYNFRPGVSPTRINDFIQRYNPEVVELQGINHRSQGNGILEYADSLLSGGNMLPTSNTVAFVSYLYPNQMGVKIKSTIKNMREQLVKQGINKPSIAVFTRTNNTARKISSHLNKKTKVMPFRVNHQIYTDEEKLTVCQRIVCELLEVSSKGIHESTSLVLEELANLHFLSSTKKDTAIANKLLQAANTIQETDQTKFPEVVTSVIGIITNIEQAISGNFVEDVGLVEQFIKNSSQAEIQNVNKVLDDFELEYQLSHIINHANSIFQKNNHFGGVKEYFLKMCYYRKLTDSYSRQKGVNVMTMHKSKGKEFDGVILFHGPYRDSLVVEGDNRNLEEDKMLCRVAITRARHLVRIIHQANDLPTFFQCN